MGSHLRRAHARRTGQCGNPARGSEHCAIFHSLCRRPVPPGRVVDFRFARHRNHWPAGKAGRASRSGAHTLVPYLILGDIHANLEALHAVLDDAKGLYEKIFCLGDLVGYGANPNEIVDWARSNVNAIVRGNHDKDCSRDDSLEHYRPIAAASAIWTRKQLTQTSVDYLRGLPRGPLRVDDFDLVHGSPGDEDEYLLMNSDAAAQLPFLEARATFFGHTHVQGGFLIARSGAKTVAPETFQLEPD